jgi:TRAP transporter TAXI family solute receptor
MGHSIRIVAELDAACVASRDCAGNLIEDRENAMFKRRFVAAATLAAGLLLASVDARAQQFVRIGSGLAGTYPVYGAKLAEMINKNFPDLRASAISGGSEQNLVKIEKGELEISITYTFQAALSADGKGELKVPTPSLRHLVSLYGAYLIPIARKDSPVSSLADLKTKPARVWIGPKASVFYPMVIGLFAAYGLAPEDITKSGGVLNTMGYQNTTQAFQDGQLDVTFMSGPAPYSLLLQLDRAPGFKMISVDEAAGKRYGELLPGITMERHKGGHYQAIPNDVVVPYTINQLVIGVRVPDDVVYRITKMLAEQHKEFHGLFPGAEEIRPEISLQGNRLELHSGAARYYREAGILK